MKPNHDSQAKKNYYRRKKKIKSILFGFAVIFIVLTIAFPVYWMFRTSVAPSKDIFQKNISLLPASVSFDNYIKVWFSEDFASNLKFKRYLLNSFLVAGIATFLSILVGVFGGYSLARFRYRGRETIANSILLIYMFPPIILIIPLMIFISKLSLYNTLPSLIIVFLSFNVPLSVWIMRGYFKDIPKELEEAALIDGCSIIKAFIKIIIPTSLPGIGAATILSFVFSWNNYIFPMVFISSEEKKLITTGFLGMVSGDLTPWGGVMASSILASIPVIIMFVLFQKSFIHGLTSGSIKD